MKIYPEKIWIDVDSRDKPFILHNEATMGMCAYIRSDLAHPEPTGDRMAAIGLNNGVRERLRGLTQITKELRHLQKLGQTEVSIDSILDALALLAGEEK